MYRSINHIILLILLVNLVNGQEINSSEDIKPKHFLKYAENAKLKNDYLLSIKYYENYLKSNPDNKNVQIKLASQYLLAKEFEKASNIYISQIKKDPKNGDVLYNYAFSQKSLGNYKTAIEYFKKSRNKKLDKEKRKQIKNHLLGCEEAKKSVTFPENITITHPDEDINSKSLEFSPFFVNDSTIIYGQTSYSELLEHSIFDTINPFSSKLYFAYKKYGKWYKIKALPEIINDPNYNIGNGCFSIDKTRFYFTKCKKNWQNKNICSIYVSEYENNSWKQPVLLPKSINDPNYTSSHPTIGTSYNPDLEILYFSSDRPKGKGGKDIWYSIYNKKTNKYSEPKNPGNKINSSDDDITPFYHKETKTLFYSSNESKGYGGFDIYKSVGEMRTWQATENVGYPINSNADDIYFTLARSQDEGFIVSNREESFKLYNEYCCYDIFEFKYNFPELISLKGQLSFEMDSVFKKFLNKGLEYRDKGETKLIASLYLMSELTKDSIYISSDTTDASGQYSFDVERDKKYKLVFHDEKEIIKLVEVSTMAEDLINDDSIYIAPVEVNLIPSGPLIISDIYYEFDKSELTEDAKNNLDASLVPLLAEKSDLIIEISSHTDNKGNDLYNLNLSQARAENVVKHLTSKGIDKNRLFAKGYGEQNSIEPNTFPDGTDNPEGREKNRRTEFKIIGTTNN